MVSKLHTLGYKNIDIHENNFILNAKGQLILIDIDSLAKGNTNIKIKTNNYWMPKFEEDSLAVQDYRRVGMLALYLLGDLNYFASSSSDLERAVLIAQIWLFQKGLNPEAINFLSNLLFSKEPDSEQILNSLSQTLQFSHGQINNADDAINKLLDSEDIVIETTTVNLREYIFNIKNDEDMAIHLLREQLHDADLTKINTGLSGLSGILYILSFATKTDVTKDISGIIEEIERRKVKIHNTMTLTKHGDRSH
jgi:hypothetical protein